MSEPCRERFLRRASGRETAARRCCRARRREQVRRSARNVAAWVVTGDPGDSSIGVPQRVGSDRGPRVRYDGSVLKKVWSRVSEGLAGRQCDPTTAGRVRSARALGRVDEPVRVVDRSDDDAGVDIRQRELLRTETVDVVGVQIRDLRVRVDRETSLGPRGRTCAPQGDPPARRPTPRVAVHRRSFISLQYK
jgi:hypothetical protein